MNLVKLANVRDERRRREEEATRMQRLYRPRLLWTSKPFRAQCLYNCNYCIEPILSGDEYTREVWVSRRSMYVKRQHYPECFAPTEEEVRDETNRIEKESNADRQKKMRKSA